MNECGGHCFYAGEMCEECRADTSEHIYRLLCGWCAEPLPELDAMYCSGRCARLDQAAMSLHAKHELERKRQEQAR